MLLVTCFKVRPCSSDIPAPCNAGLDGIEAIYSTYSDEEESYVRSLAAKYNLLITGGSDFHGTNKPDIAIGKGRGNLHIPYAVLDNLKSALSK